LIFEPLTTTSPVALMVSFLPSIETSPFFLIVTFALPTWIVQLVLDDHPGLLADADLQVLARGQAHVLAGRDTMTLAPAVALTLAAGVDAVGPPDVLGAVGADHSPSLTEPDLLRLGQADRLVHRRADVTW
jgi:hypothetical protein